MSEKKEQLENLFKIEPAVSEGRTDQEEMIPGSIQDAIKARLLSFPSAADEIIDPKFEFPAWNSRYIDLFNCGNQSRYCNDYNAASKYFSAAQKLVKEVKNKGENSRLLPVRHISCSYMKIMCFNAAQTNPRSVMRELHDMSFKINEFLQEAIEFFPNVKDLDIYKKYIFEVTQNGYVDMEKLSEIANYMHQQIVHEYLVNLKRYTRSNVELDNKINNCILLVNTAGAPHDLIKKKLLEIAALILEQRNFNLENSYPFPSLFDVIEKIWTMHFFITRYGTMHNQFYARCSFNLSAAQNTNHIVETAAENAQIAKLLLPDSFIQKDCLRVRQFLSNQTGNWLIPQTEVHALLENVYETGDSDKQPEIFPERIKQQLENLIFIYTNNETEDIHAVDFENAVEKLATYHFASAWSDLTRYTTSFNELETLLSFRQLNDCPKNKLLIYIFQCRLALRCAMLRKNRKFDDSMYAVRGFKSRVYEEATVADFMLPDEYADTVLKEDRSVDADFFHFDEEGSTIQFGSTENVVFFSDEVPDINTLYNNVLNSYEQIRKIDPLVVEGDRILKNYFEIITARIKLLEYEMDSNHNPAPLQSIISLWNNAIQPDGTIERQKSAYQIQAAEKYFVLGQTFVKLALSIFNSSDSKMKSESDLEKVFHNIELAETCLCEANGILSHLDHKDAYLFFEIEKAYKELMDVHLLASGVSESKRNSVISRLDMNKILNSFNIQKWSLSLRKIIKMFHGDTAGMYQEEVAKHLNSVLLQEAPYLIRTVVCHRPTSKEPNFLSSHLPYEIKKVYREAIHKQHNPNNDDTRQTDNSPKYAYNTKGAGLVYVFPINDFYAIVIDSCYELNEKTKEFIRELLTSIDSLFTIHSISNTQIEGDIHFIFDDKVSLMENARILAHQLHMPHYPSVKHQTEVGRIAEKFYDFYWNKNFPDALIDVRIAQLEGEIHDLGKSEMNPRLIWEKEAGLNRAERVIIEQHPEKGAELSAKLLGRLCEENIAVMSAHHCNYGLGYSYPFKAMGAEGYLIPRLLNQRITADCDSAEWTPVIDKFDFKAFVRSRMLPIFDQAQAISDCDRVYRKPESFENVVSFLKTLAGKDFDPRLVFLFIDAANEGCFDDMFLREEFESEAIKYLNNNYVHLTDSEVTSIIRFISANQTELKKVLSSGSSLFDVSEEIDFEPFVNHQPHDPADETKKFMCALKLLRNGLPLPAEYTKFKYPHIFESDLFLEFFESKFASLTEDEKNSLIYKPLQNVIKILQTVKGKGLYMSAECLHSTFRSEFVQAIKPVFSKITITNNNPFDAWSEMKERDPERYKTAMIKYSKLFSRNPELQKDRKAFLETLENENPDEYYKILKQFAKDNYYHYIDMLFAEMRQRFEANGLYPMTKEEILKSPTDKIVASE